MAGIQIYTESPISPAIPPNGNNPTTKASNARDSSKEIAPEKPPHHGTENQRTGTLAKARSGSTDSQSTAPLASLAEPQISPPTPTAAYGQSVNDSLHAESKPTEQERSSAASSAPSSPHLNALPSPVPSRSRSASPRRDIPPPPRVGEKMKPASYYSPAPTPTYPSHQPNLPSAIGVPSLSDPRGAFQAPPSATARGQNGLLSPYPNSLFSPARAFGSPAQTPTTMDAPQKNFEHPPGYVQNPYAADMTPEQRFASQHAAGSPSLGYNDANSGLAGLKSPSGMFQGLGAMASPRPGGGILNGDGKADDGTVWGVVSGWAKGAGKKLSEVEGEVWRRINGD